jgi:hypothetical protein
MLVRAAPALFGALMHLASITVLYAQPTELVIVGENGSPSSAFPLGQCQGTCNSDVDVRTSLLPSCQYHASNALQTANLILCMLFHFSAKVA